jgi:hypothetical protein
MTRNRILAYLRTLCCRHSWRVLSRIYGDEIHCRGCRAILMCQKCGKQVRTRVVP